MSQRTPKWLVFVCATFILGACSSDTSVLGPVSAPVDTRPAVAPSLSAVDAGNSASHGNSESNGRGRYAMAAN